jgi:hypothetical protein
MMPLREVITLPGDVVLSNTRSRASLWIMIGQLLRNPRARVDVTHAMVAMGGILSPPSVVEALLTVRETPLDRYEGEELVIWRPTFLSDAERYAVAVSAESLIGHWYAPGKIVLFALDGLTGWNWSGLFGWERFKTCGNVLAWSYFNATGNAYTFGRHWKDVTPSDIDTWCLRHPETWELVYSSIRARA